MTEEQIEYLNNVTISKGGHMEDSGLTCGIEAISVALGSRFSDHEESVCPVIGSFYRSWQDSLPDDETRNRLCRPLLVLMAGTKSTPEVEQQRACLCADYAVRVFAPLALDAAGLEGEAASLRGLDAVTDKRTADAASKAPADAAYAADAAHAASAAYRAASAAYRAASAAYWAASAAYADGAGAAAYAAANAADAAAYAADFAAAGAAYAAANAAVGAAYAADFAAAGAVNANEAACELIRAMCALGGDK